MTVPEPEPESSMEMLTDVLERLPGVENGRLVEMGISMLYSRLGEGEEPLGPVDYQRAMLMGQLAQNELLRRILVTLERPADSPLNPR
jgi:hypothetical protein